jgi:cation:H+ antiporter
MTDVSAALLNAPNLAVGDLFGSNMANMLILGIIDLVHRQKKVWQQATYAHTLSATLAMALTGLAGLFVLLKTELEVWNVGLDTVLIMLLYLLGMRVVYRQEDMQRRQRALEHVVEVETDEHPLRNYRALKKAAMGFAVASLVIVVTAPVLASSSKTIAELTGLGTTVVGVSLVALTTSLPELVTSLAAVRLAAFDLAVGNLFGSNAFNMVALFVTDLAYRPGPLLSAVSDTQVIAAFLSLLLMNLGLMGIVYRAEKRYLLIEPDSLLMILGYGLSMWVLFRVGE